jgi:hypothetical protein
VRRKLPGLLASCVAALSLVLTACSSPAPEEPEPTLTAREQGVWNVATLEEASQIAGFPVATPAYLPEGFYRGSNIMVSQPGAGLPEDIKPKFSNMIVEQFYYYQGDDSVMFILTQTQHKSGIGGSEPTEICGRPAERAYQEANPQRKYPSPMLTLGWENDGSYYQITGTLVGPLDEATLEKIACSVEVG